MLDLIRKGLKRMDELVELIIAIFLLFAIFAELVRFVPVIGNYVIGRNLDVVDFHSIMSTAFALVIGTEFFKMMLKPSMENVTEVLIFLISRHMIVEENSPTDHLISVISITILFLVQFFMIRNKKLGERALYSPFTQYIYHALEARQAHAAAAAEQKQAAGQESAPVREAPAVKEVPTAAETTVSCEQTTGAAQKE